MSGDPRNGRRAHRPPAMQFYFEDFFADEHVMRMSNEAIGVYLRLLASAWRHGSIPADEPALAAIGHVAPRLMKRLWEQVRPCWTAREDGRLVQARMERERAVHAAYCRKQAERGSAGAGARWGRGASMAPAMLAPSPEHGASMLAPSSGDGARMAALGHPQAMLGDGSPVPYPLSPVTTPPPPPRAADVPGDGERHAPPAGGASGGAAAPGKTAEPLHDRARDVAEYLRAGIEHWKPDAAATRTAAQGASLRAIDLMLRRDGRDPDKAIALISWLFGDEPGDYRPSPSFDWRPNIQSGGALRDKWDRLESDMKRPKEVDHGRRA